MHLLPSTADTDSTPAQHKHIYYSNFIYFRLDCGKPEHNVCCFYSIFMFLQDVCNNGPYTTAVKLRFLCVLDLLSCSSTCVTFVNFHKLPSELCLSLFLFWDVLITEHLLCFQKGIWWLAPVKKAAFCSFDHLIFVWGGQKYSIRETIWFKSLTPWGQHDVFHP